MSHGHDRSAQGPGQPAEVWRERLLAPEADPDLWSAFAAEPEGLRSEVTQALKQRVD